MKLALLLLALAAIALFLRRRPVVVTYEYGGALAVTLPPRDSYLLDLIDRAGAWPPGSRWTA